MRFMSVDYGTKRLGLALTDPTRSFVARAFSISPGSDKKAAENIAELARNEKVSKIILGYPLNDDGTKGAMAEKVENFKARLEKLIDVEIILADERYTSEEAEKLLHRTGKRIKGHKHKIDAISAALILNDYLLDAEGT